MIYLFYSKGQIFNVNHHSQDLKICFYEYDYKATSEQVDRMVKSGYFAFVEFDKTKAIRIEMSPHYNSVIERKKISYVEINEILIGSKDEYLTSMIKMSEFAPRCSPDEIKNYEERCYKMIKDRK